MSGHTKGPWEAKESKYNSERFIVQAEMPSLRVLASFDGDGDGYDEIDIANARLISAAPDLLEALKECREAMYADNPADGWLEIIKSADAAISKATGAA